MHKLTLSLACLSLLTVHIVFSESTFADDNPLPRFLTVVPAEPQFYKFDELPPITVSKMFPDRYQGDDIVGRNLEGDSISLTLVSLLQGVKSPHHNHPSEEFITVTKGSLKVVSAGKTFTLMKGDSVRFPSFVPHHVEALENAEIVEVFGPPAKKSPSNR